ncbi:hypothetical protein [Rhizobium sp.]|uniref:hypothetical protein n=1 Tax=Rhizobium sp. TaxID=391 RepID=UPI002EE5EAB2
MRDMAYSIKRSFAIQFHFGFCEHCVRREAPEPEQNTRNIATPTIAQFVAGDARYLGAIQHSDPIISLNRRAFRESSK